MPNLKRAALKEWDDEVRGLHEEVADVFEEIPAILQFKGSDLHPEVVVPSEPIWGQDDYLEMGPFGFF